MSELMNDYPNNCLHCGGVAEVIKGEWIATKKTFLESLL